VYTSSYKLFEGQCSTFTDTVRFLNDIGRSVKIYSKPLSKNEQSKLRFYEIAHLACQNG